MVAGTQVYHKELKMNLIVCQINAKGKVICINPKVYEDDVYQTITVDMSKLQKGWKAMY